MQIIGSIHGDENYRLQGGVFVIFFLQILSLSGTEMLRSCSESFDIDHGQNYKIEKTDEVNIVRCVPHTVFQKFSLLTLCVNIS
jgi:hypothetical protein